MRNFTFLFMILFVATLANAQESQRLQHKIKRVQEIINSEISVPGSRAEFSPYVRVQENAMLKNALATEKLDSVLYQGYMHESSSWQNEWKDEYEYNSELNNTVSYEKEWDASLGTWTITEKAVLDYTANGKVNAADIYTPDETTGELVYQNRTVAYYNPEERLDSVVHYTYVTEPVINWDVQGREVYYYHESGQVERIEITSLEEDEEGTYLLIMAIVNSYNTEGQISTSAMYVMESGLELLFSETTFIYDDSGRLTATEISVLDYFTFGVVPGSRTEYDFNANGDVSLETFFSWDESVEEWKVEQKSEYSYSSKLLSEVVFPYYLLFWGIYDQSATYNYAVTEIETSEYIDGEWSLSDRTVFYYSEGTTTGTGDLTEASFSVYPNPASDMISLQWDGYGKLWLEIYSLTGAKAMEQQVSAGTNVQVSTLQDGIYLLKLTNGNELVYTGKLIKR